MLRRAPIFQGLSDDGLARVAEKAHMHRFPAGAELMRQGEASHAMFIISEGRVRVELAAAPGLTPAVLAELGAGDVVGEMGVLDKKPRSATVVAVSTVEALQLGVASLTDVMVHHPEVREALTNIVTDRLRNTDALVARMFSDILERVDIFKPVSSEALTHLAERGEHRFYESGEALMTQGEPSSSLHIIASGSVRVERSHPDRREPMILATLGRGEIVGEMSVLDEVPHSASVVAATHVETMELQAADLAYVTAQYPGVMSALLHVMTSRMRSTDQMLEELISRDHRR